MKYNVRVYLSTFYDIEVEAMNENKAIEFAESSENWTIDDIVENMALMEGASEIF